MLHLHDGQCGLCAHFGETHASDPKLVQIRKSKTASDEVVDECGHPKLMQLHLMVAPNSGCNGFKPAKPN